jgi:hypothetical protein
MNICEWCGSKVKHNKCKHCGGPVTKENSIDISNVNIPESYWDDMYGGDESDMAPTWVIVAFVVFTVLSFILVGLRIAQII